MSIKVENSFVVRFDVLKRTIFIYDSMKGRGNRTSKDTKQAVDIYAKVIPFYLEAFSVLIPRNEIMDSPLYHPSNKYTPLDIVYETDLPKQSEWYEKQFDFFCMKSTLNI